MKSTLSRSAAVALSLLAGTAWLSACNRADDGSTAGQNTDAVVAQAERKAEDVGSSTRDAGRDAGQAVGNATDAVANKSRDMAITTTLNAKLAADERLSALKINVDTVDGRVVLRGTAPDTAARTHATELARSVEGVTDVTNELSVQLPAR
jgi:hypothetical protein